MTIVYSTDKALEEAKAHGVQPLEPFVVKHKDDIKVDHRATAVVIFGQNKKAKQAYAGICPISVFPKGSLASLPTVGLVEVIDEAPEEESETQGEEDGAGDQ